MKGWLECVLDFTVAALAVIVMGVAVGTRSATGGAKMGVALLNIVTLGEHLKALVKFWTMLETTITAAARIKSFVGTTPQEPGPIEEGYSEDETEQNSGMSIKLENISARYSSVLVSLIEGSAKTDIIQRGWTKRYIICIVGHRSW